MEPIASQPCSSAVTVLTLQRILSVQEGTLSCKHDEILEISNPHLHFRVTLKISIVKDASNHKIQRTLSKDKYLGTRVIIIRANIVLVGGWKQKRPFLKSMKDLTLLKSYRQLVIGPQLHIQRYKRTDKSLETNYRYLYAYIQGSQCNEGSANLSKSMLFKVLPSFKEKINTSRKHQNQTWFTSCILCLSRS